MLLDRREIPNPRSRSATPFGSIAPKQKDGRLTGTDAQPLTFSFVLLNCDSQENTIDVR